MDSIQYCYPIYALENERVLSELEGFISEQTECLPSDSTFPELLLYLSVSSDILRDSVGGVEYGDTTITLWKVRNDTWRNLGPRYVGVTKVSGIDIFIETMYCAHWYRPIQECKSFYSHIIDVNPRPSQWNEVRGDTAPPLLTRMPDVYMHWNLKNGHIIAQRNQGFDCYDTISLYKFSNSQFELVLRNDNLFLLVGREDLYVSYGLWSYTDNGDLLLSTPDLLHLQDNGQVGELNRLHLGFEIIDSVRLVRLNIDESISIEAPDNDRINTQVLTKTNSQSMVVKSWMESLNSLQLNHEILED